MAGVACASRPAGVDEDSVAPAGEEVGVTQPGKLLPDLHQRLLGHISGKLPVAQDPMRHRMEPIAKCHGQLAKGDSIALTRPLHEFSLHFPSPSCS